jgi:hypothetical protein
MRTRTTPVWVAAAVAATLACPAAGAQEPGQSLPTGEPQQPPAAGSPERAPTSDRAPQVPPAPRPPQRPAAAELHPKDSDPLKDYRVPPPEKKYLDPRVEPILLFRFLLATTEKDYAKFYTPEGRSIELDTTKMDPGFLGYRKSWVADTAELGLRGRFEDGFYYLGRFNLVPREKDGNRSSNYLRDAYAGWNRYRFLDIRIGLQKTPFSAANLKPTTEYPLVNAPLLNLLTLDRQVGGRMTLSDPTDTLLVTGGMFNSVLLVTEQLNNGDQMLYVGRAELRPDRALKAAGISVGDVEWTIGANLAQVERNYDPPTKHRWTGIDTRLRAWIVTVEAEYVAKDFFGDTLADGTQRSERGSGWHVTGTVRVLPKLLSASARFEQERGDSLDHGFNATLSTDELAKQRKQWITGGVSVLLGEHARVDFNYVHKQMLQGYRLRHDAAMGMFQYSL